MLIIKKNFFYLEQHKIANKNDHKSRRSEKKGKNLYILVHMTPLFFLFFFFFCTRVSINYVAFLICREWIINAVSTECRKIE